MKAWSSTQAVLALSSAEAELYALVKGSAVVLGCMSLLQDLGQDTNGKVHCDSSAALGIVQRRGLGKLRHLNVQYLWVQERVREADFAVQKIDGEVNPADLMTKNLDETKMWRHLVKLDYFQLGGRATSAPTMQAMLAMLDGNGCVHGGAQEVEEMEIEEALRARGEETMRWQVGDGLAVMVHDSARVCLTTPLRVFRLATGTNVVIRQGD